MKRVLALAVPLLMLLTLSAQALEPKIPRADPALDFNGTTAVCSAVEYAPRKMYQAID